MDRAQLLNDSEEAMRLVLDGRQANIWTAMPGTITAVDLDEMTCEVQPAIKASVEDENGNIQIVNLPVLIHVPIVFPSAGGFALTFPIAVGNEVLVVWACRAIDSWWQSGGEQKPVEARMHDLSDGFAIPGPKSQPNVLANISTTRTELRNNGKTVYFSVGTKFAMKNATTDLKTLLQGLVNSLTTFSTGLNTGNLAANAAALVTALTTTTTQITALLEDS